MSMFNGERALAVLGAAAVLVVGANAVSYATTGDTLLLGKTNRAEAVTGIHNTGTGSALRLTTKLTTSAPFTTNAKGKVTNLYADRSADANTLGGRSAAQILTEAAPTTTTYVDSKDHATDAVTYTATVAAGTYLVSFDADVKLNTHGTTSVPNPMVCQLQTNGTTKRALAEGAWNGVGTFWYAAPSFSRVVTLDADTPVLWYCSTDKHDGWTVPADGFGPTMSFTELGAQTTVDQ